MDIKQTYAVLYCSGMYGTWLTWFINQHPDFPKYDKNKSFTDGHHTDWYCTGATWCFTDDIQDGALDKPLDFNEYEEHIANKLTRNNAAYQNCIKILPDHDMSWKKHYDNEYLIRDMFAKNIEGIIIPYMPHDSHFIPYLVARNNIMWPERIPQWDESIHTVITDIEVGKYKKFERYTNVHYLNFHEFLLGNQEEFHKLLLFIDSYGHEDWLEYINDLRDTLVTKDWDNLKKG